VSIENQNTIKEVVSVMQQLLSANNISKIEHSWETPPVEGKIITCHKNEHNRLTFSLRRTDLSPVFTISDEVFDSKGNIITNNKRSLNRLYQHVHRIAHHLGPDCYR